MALLLTKSHLTKLYGINLKFEKYYIWLVLNLYLLLTAPFNGFESIAPTSVAETNPDIVFCGVSFFGLLFLSPGLVAYAVSRHQDLKLIPPSLKRFPLNWWIDPLQCLYISALGTVLTALGAFFGYRHYGGDLGYWTMMWYLSTALGLSGGVVLVHIIYRKRIAPSSNCKPLG
jgi:hypothetical protein